MGFRGTVDGRKLAPVDMVHIPIINRVLYISGFLPSTGSFGGNYFRGPKDFNMNKREP